MTVYQWLCVIGIPSVVTLLLSRLITRRLDAAEQETRKAREEAEHASRQSEAIALGVQALLRNALLQGYKHCQDQGYADFQERATLENAWVQYHTLGGNGAMCDSRRAFRALPMYRGGPPTPVDD